MNVFVCHVIAVMLRMNIISSQCVHYTHHRGRLSLKTLKKYPNPVPLSNPITLREISYLLNNTSYNILKITIKYMKQCFEIRPNV